MLQEQNIIMKWNPKNIKWYTDKGYIFTKVGKEFQVSVFDLPSNSRTNIEVTCDYCNKPYPTTFNSYSLCQNNSVIKKDSCVECKYEKVRESNLEKYGVYSVAQVPEFQEKRMLTCNIIYGGNSPACDPNIVLKMKQTTIDRYGVPYYTQTKEYKLSVKKSNIKRYHVSSPMKLEQMKNKVKETCLKKYGVPSVLMLDSVKEKIRHTTYERYGVDNYTKTDECQAKRKNTCLQKYGCESPSQSEEVKEKIFETNIERYGTPCVFSNEEIINKCNQTKYNNQSTTSSTQQRYLNKILNGELNYPVSNCSLDIAFLDEKTYIEYDGSGHELSIKFNTFTKEEFIKREFNRNYFLNKKGWKRIRIISIKDKLPSDKIIVSLINQAKEYLNTGHSWFEINIDEGKIKCSQYEIDYDFGKLRKIKKEDLKEQESANLAI